MWLLHKQHHSITPAAADAMRMQCGTSQQLSLPAGTVSDGTLRSSNASVFIVKSTAFELGRSTTWLFATDNSEAAQQAFIILVHR